MDLLGDDPVADPLVDNHANRARRHVPRARALDPIHGGIPRYPSGSAHYSHGAGLRNDIRGQFVFDPGNRVL